jgi:hypothetical protein
MSRHNSEVSEPSFKLYFIKSFTNWLKIYQIFYNIFINHKSCTRAMKITRLMLTENSEGSLFICLLYKHMYLYLLHPFPPYSFSILFTLLSFTFPFFLFFMINSIINIILNTQLQKNKSEKYNLFSLIITTLL